MKDGKQIRLTSAELGQLWTQYMNESASNCMLTYFLNKAEDEEISSVIGRALELSQSHLKKITKILTEEQNTIPHGFKLGEDVDEQAPRLYSDAFVLNFIHNMSKIGLLGYAHSLSVSVREDITAYFSECMIETIQCYKIAKDLLLSKGLYIRAPYLPNLEEVEYVQKLGFMIDLFGDKRPLQALEITNLYTNIQRNALAAATLEGFSQVAHDKDVKKFFQKGIEVTKKHIALFSAKLRDSDLPAPMTWDSDVTTSAAHTFSDRIMMFYISAFTALSIEYYGTSIAECPRFDLGQMFNALSAEVQKYAERGATIMIHNKWLEKPPMAPDRNKLASQS
ncbi:DUF3231 family protein [Pullulanibacillus sp. KACC 23026]|uniref:DUF3231 family protein n=1 Tax=Pullulanibacillus sp. KACC 23026 TaxID=3028315 RepID=UPI0023B0E24D|nr:DUF3231 family protein [Pullulanibacillus sp. KACC 23026]WEG14027.1 DUF3231 family protein [Pullulanibacillus sp. KACC 23026]